MRRALLFCAAIVFAIACGDDLTDPTTSTPGTATGTAGTPKALFATTTTDDGLSISTDKDDYAPGDTVHFTGAGWPANDVLDIVLVDDLQKTHTWSVSTAQDGTFQDSTYVVDVSDIGVTFTLTATSRATGRLLVVVFTDGNFKYTTSPNNLVATLPFQKRSGTTCGAGTLEASGTLQNNTNINIVTGSHYDISVPAVTGFTYNGYTSSGNVTVSPASSPSNSTLCIVTSANNQAGSIDLQYQDITTTEVTHSPAATIAGQQVTFTATVKDHSGNPVGNNGSVTFYELTGTQTCSAPGTATVLSGPTNLSNNPSGQASFQKSDLAVGTHITTACYSGTSTLKSSSGSVTHVVSPNAVATTTTVTSSKNPSGSTESVTFTAAVKSGTSATPVTTGQVTFKEGGNNCADAAATQLQAPTNVNGTTGQVTFTTSALAIGSHTIRACYGGATGFLAGEGSVVQQVNNTATVTEIAPSINPSVTGQSVTFTATVKRDGSPVGANGSVSFRQGSTDCTDGTQVKAPTALDASGQATYAASFLASGSPFNIRACYGGSASPLLAASNASLVQNAGKGGTSTDVTTSKASAVYSEAVTFDVTVSPLSPAGGTPSGNVTLTDGPCGGTTLGLKTLSAGKASFTLSTIGVGAHSINACFDATDDYTASSSEVDQTVTQALTTTSIVSNHNPSVFSQQVTFTATVAKVAPATASPTGNVSFERGGTACGVGTTPLGSAVALDANGKASFSISTLDAAAYTIRACYAGTSNFQGSADDLTQTVNQAATTTTIVSDHNPSVFSQQVTFTATVASVSPAEATPTGNVTFEDGGSACGTGSTVLATKTLSTSGDATFSTSDLAVASHTVRACYAATTNFGASDKSVNQVVNKAETTTDLTSSSNPSVFSEHINLNITVQVVSPGTATPDGQVTLKDGPCTTGTTLGGPTALDGNGKATFNISSLAVGTHHLSACYPGTASFVASTGTLDQEVIRASTTTQLTSSANPSVFSQPVDLKATVQVVAPGTLTPTGDVTLKDGTCSAGDPIGAPVTLDTYGKATFSLSTLSVGTHNLSACYAGNVSFVESFATLVQTVNKAGTTTTLTSSTNPSVFSQSVPLSVTVNVKAPGTQTPDGSVTLKDGDCTTGTSVGSATTLDGGGNASFNISNFTVGTHSLSACYPGNGNFESSVGTLVQTVNKASTTTAMTSTANPSVYSQPVGVHVDVTVVAPAVAIPVGDVTVKEGSCDAGTTLAGPTAVDANGKASFDLPILSVGAHGLTACYAGNDNFVASYAYLTQTVNQASTTTAIVSSVQPVSILAQNVTFDVAVAKVSPATATPDGNVTLKEGSCSAAGSLAGPTAVNASGQASFNISSLPIGSHDIYACYAGTTNFKSSSNFVTQEVRYNFVGFSAPVDRPNTMNVSKAGQAIPLKWRLTDYLNRPITDLTGVTIKTVAMSCDNGGVLDPIEEYSTASTSGLLNLGDGNYQYNWKTATTLAGTCKSLALVFGTGGLSYTEGPRAFFSFKK